MKYAPTATDIERNKGHLKAELLNLIKEIELIEFLTSTIPKYTGPLNKRFETFINKELAIKYGTYEYKYYDESYGVKAGTASEYDKTINNISAWLSSETYSKKYYKIGLHYQGTEFNYNSDDKEYKYTSRQKTVEAYSWESLFELVAQLESKLTYTNQSIIKIKDNQKHLDKYARECNKLVDQINAYNDKISYVISDSYRIK